MKVGDGQKLENTWVWQESVGDVVSIVWDTVDRLMEEGDLEMEQCIEKLVHMFHPENRKRQQIISVIGDALKQVLAGNRQVWELETRESLTPLLKEISFTEVENLQNLAWTLSRIFTEELERRISGKIEPTGPLINNGD